MPNDLVVDVVQFLLKHEADVNPQRDDLSTPLHLAAARRYFQVAQMLFQRRADVNSWNTGGETPLHLVTECTFPRSEDNRLNLIWLLLKYGAEVNSRDYDSTPLRNVLNLEVARMFLNHGAYVNAEDNRRRTPLHRVLEFKYEGHFDVAQLLVKHGADIKAQDKGHQTPLHLASCLLEPKVVRVLLDHGANVNTEDNQGRTPLHQVLESEYDGHFDVAQLLVEHGADVNARVEDRQTPLHSVSSYNPELKLVRMLSTMARMSTRRTTGAGPHWAECWKPGITLTKMLMFSVLHSC